MVKGGRMVWCGKRTRARAEVRQGAELWVRRHNPLSWLRPGPGRERRGRPGWTESDKVGDESPEGEPGSYVDLRAERDLPVAFSACPDPSVGGRRVDFRKET